MTRSLAALLTLAAACLPAACGAAGGAGGNAAGGASDHVAGGASGRATGDASSSSTSDATHHGAAQRADGDDAVALADDGTPRWIWSAAEARPHEALVFRKEFELVGPVVRAELIASCDNELLLTLDGREHLRSDSWEQPVACDLTAAFAHDGPRQHVLSVRAENHDGPAGLLLQLRIERQGQEPLLLLSDASFRVAVAHDDAPDAHEGSGAGDAPVVGDAPIAGDGSVASDAPVASGTPVGSVPPATEAELEWRPAVEVARLGDEPWASVTPELLAATPRRRAPTATPVEQLRAAPGFAVELLYSPTSEQGSWVSLCVDPAGRLIVSDQRDAGLFRITLPDVATAPATPLRVERIDVPLSGAQGLLWAFDALYALVGSHDGEPGGLYRLRDSDGDDRLDDLECLRELQGGGEHGWHALLPTPDGEALYAVAGNDTTLTELSASRVPLHWGEDQLLPRLPDANGFMTDVLAPGGGIYRVDPDGKHWELCSIGYRNAYDAALDADGELFTFDSDMEWDLNTPWYRPTRLCLVTSGSDYGWRNGSGKFPAHFADTLPPVLELGPGSPVGMTFGHGAAFPERWQRALFLGDWSYGRVHAVHLQPDGAGFRGEAELFLSGTPLPVTDLLVNPRDGALYLVTGGRDVQGGLYRVTYVGGEGGEGGLHRAGGRHGGSEGGLHRESEREGEILARQARDVRRDLEAFHAHPEHADLDRIWSQLGSDDRFLRHAARIALELQPVQAWLERALAEPDPQAAITALVALARASGRDAPHRVDAEALPGAEAAASVLRSRLLAALAALPWDALEAGQRLELLRALSLVFTRLGPPDDTQRAALVARWSPLYPSGEPRLDGALCTLLAFLQDEGLAAKAVPRLQSAPTQEEQLDIARCLRVLEAGWSPALRRDLFAWFVRAASYRGGNSFAGFVRAIRADALDRVPEGEREALLAEFGEALPGTTPLLALQAPLAGRQLVQQWTSEALLPQLQPLLADAAARDPLRGRQLFGAVGCFACHRVGGEGGSVGPDLGSAGRRFALADLLTAIVDPSATVSDQYQLSRIDTLDGETFTGHIVNLSGDSVDLSLDLFRPGELHTLDRGLIASIRPASVSAMPEGLVDVLEAQEIADLLAYLLANGQD